MRTRSVIDALSEQSMIDIQKVNTKCDRCTKWTGVMDTQKIMKCDGYTKVNKVNMCMIDTQNEDVCDRYRKWECDWYTK